MNTSKSSFSWGLALIALLIAFASVAQDGPPPVPPYPADALNFYPLETPPWPDYYGDAASGFTNLNVAASWDGAATALSVDTNVPAFLQYSVYQDGWTNMTFGLGSLSVWFQANWTSLYDGGTGPTNWATLLSVGNWTTNAGESAWTIAISPSGTNLVMEAQAEGSNQVVFNVPIDFDAGDWHALTITYEPTNCCLYLEGQFVTNAGPIRFEPTYEDCLNYGMFVGSLSTSGDCQFHGQLQWLTTYDHPLSADAVAANYASVSAYITYWGGSLPSRGFHPDDGPPVVPGGGGGFTNLATNTFPQPDFTTNSTTNYGAYSNFWLTISNSPTTAYVTVEGTLSNLTYVLLTNGNLAATNGWGTWQVLAATNNVTPAPPLSIGTNVLFVMGELAWATGTNGLPDYWCMQYFKTLNVNPYADADGDGLCNLDEFILGTNPTNAHSISSIHNDAQALYLAYTNDSACHYHISVANGTNTNTLLVTFWPTVVGTNYQIYSQAASNAAWIVETNFVATNTNTTVAIYLNGRTLSLIGGDGEDQDGDGLPSGYEVLATHTDPLLPDTGVTGTPDAYKDPDGDGFANIVEYYNGTDPLVFNTPAGPLNLVADTGSTTNSYNLIWQPAAGPVIGYIVSVWNYTSYQWVTLSTNTATQLSYALAANPNYDHGYGITRILYSVQAIYTNGFSMANAGGAVERAAMAQAAVTYGPGGKAYLLTSAVNTNVTGYMLTTSGGDTAFPLVSPYGQTQTTYSPSTPASFFIAASQFTNGVAVLTDAQVPPYTIVDGQELQPQLSEGVNWNEVWTRPQGLGSFVAVPFIDASTAMKQNVSFLLRAGGDGPFSYVWNTGATIYASFYPSNYVFSSYYYDAPYYIYGESFGPDSRWWDPFAPFEDNYFFANLTFNPNYIDNSGSLDTGFNSAGSFYPDADAYYVYPLYYQYSNAPVEFPTYDYITSNSQSAIPTLLAANQSQWVGYYSSTIEDFGAYSISPSLLGMSNNASNVYGLPYTSLEVTYPGDPVHFATLTPGSTVSNNPHYGNAAFYVGTAQPELETVSYLFAAGTNPIPEYLAPDFSVTNTTPLILGSVGTVTTVFGFAKQEVLNGDNDVFAYVGQYFTNAFVMSNGVATTNVAGVLSEYGVFFPTVPGQIALITKPDTNQNNMRGTNVLEIIRLSLDVNHDGIMDESFTGPDNTGNAMPYVFWVNNDYDRWVWDDDDDAWEEDDVLSASNPGVPLNFTIEPDYNYTNYDGYRAIPCPRDLEDYARLWVSGVSNTLSRLPSDSTVTLSWAGIGSSPTIDLFQAADVNGGIGYLTNLVTASNQIDPTHCLYVGRLGPGQSIQLNASTFSNNWAGDHYIWCGVAFGSDQLNLTISDGSGNVLAQSSQYIQLQDIKQMYERWTAGDIPSRPPMTNVVLAEDNFSPGAPTTSFPYPYDPAYDTNDTYILYVHGWNMEPWEKDRWAETAYKRLYWQGYQGRFGLFRWPTDYGFAGAISIATNITEKDNFDSSEFNAWQSGAELLSLLKTLRGYYGTNVYVLAHSMGNIVAGEALRLGGSNNLVNVYAASQAAVTAQAYDASIPDYSFVDLPWSYSVDTPNIYGSWFLTNLADNGGSVRSIINLYNTNDYALARSHWQLDELMKPDRNVLESGVTWYYGYNGSASDPPPWNNFYKERTNLNTILTFNFNIVTNLNNRYEVMAYDAQAYSTALGATPAVFPLYNFDLTSIWPIDPLGGDYNEHLWHSAEFRSDVQSQTGYWQNLMQSSFYGFNLSKPNP